VHVKVERGNEVLVRVGGGFISAQKFIESYMQNEVERVERQDVVGRFQNKLYTQNIAASQSVYSVESSPIRTPRRNGSHTSRKSSRSPRPTASAFKARAFKELNFQRDEEQEQFAGDKNHTQMQIQ
jgi:hypothetical protein